eukprot:385421-Pyramimonas_sp.AAC.2
MEVPTALPVSEVVGTPAAVKSTNKLSKSRAARLDFSTDMFCPSDTGFGLIRALVYNVVWRSSATHVQ